MVADWLARRIVGGGRTENAAALMSDIRIIEPAQAEKAESMKRRKIGIAVVREALLFLSRYPALGVRRALIVDQAELLTAEAQNALLKTLEEPNTTSLLILVTHQPELLLPTLRSRLAVFAFDILSPQEMRAAFGTALDTIPDFFVRLGQPGLIARALAAPKDFASEKELLAELFQLSRLSLRERSALAERLSRNEERLPFLLETWLLGLRSQARIKESPVIWRDYLSFFEPLLLALEQTSQLSGNVRLVLERLLLSYR